METTLAKLAVQIPDLCALIVIVVLFLRFLKERDAVLRDLHAEHLLAREASRQAISDNTKLLGAMVESMKMFTIASERCSEASQRQENKKNRP